MTKWIKTTAERYDEMLGVLPPEYHVSHGFLVGEPFSHRRCKVTGQIAPVFETFIQRQFDDFDKFSGRQDEFFESDDPLTVDEFKALVPGDLPITA